MSPDTVKNIFLDSVCSVSSDISLYAVSPGTDFTRFRKLPPQKLIPFLVSQGASSTRNELLDFFGMDQDRPSASALNQQRAKLKPEALEEVFLRTSFSLSLADPPPAGYRTLAADGSDFTFMSRPRFAPPQYFVSEGHSAKGFYSLHLNAFYDLTTNTYSDAVIQPVHEKDEFRAFCQMADRHQTLPGTRDIFIGDRGYCSYNNMAHVVEKGQYFLFRTKDIHSKGLVNGFGFPPQGSFDITVNVTLVRSHRKTIRVKEGWYRRYVDAAASFDYVDYGSADTYDLTFRVVRFPLSDTSWECIVTNLPREEFPTERVKELYALRWGIETSFRKLKYTIGLSSFHSCKPEYVKQEIWAKLTAYNLTETVIRHAVQKRAQTEQKTTKHVYQVNFSVAAHICRVFLRLPAEKDRMDVETLLLRELVPVRNERQYPRLKTAHFRRPRHFLYRAA